MGQVTAFFHDRRTLGRRRIVSGIIAVTLLAVMIGCGTTRMSDTQRTATEQLLISNAVDQAVSQIDFRFLAGRPVYFDPQYLDGTVDKGYVISSLRQQLLASGCELKEDRSKAVYVVEARAGAVGTDRHSLLVGIPQMTVPTRAAWCVSSCLVGIISLPSAPHGANPLQRRQAADRHR
jgi:hypothetical protein